MDFVLKMMVHEPKLSGPLPDGLSELQLLTRMDLAGNGFHGRIPAALGELPSLRRVNWRHGAVFCGFSVEFRLTFDCFGLFRSAGAGGRTGRSDPSTEGRSDNDLLLCPVSNFFVGGKPLKAGVDCQGGARGKYEL